MSSEGLRERPRRVLTLGAAGFEQSLGPELGEVGFEVCGVGSVVEALDVLEEWKPHVVLVAAAGAGDPRASITALRSRGARSCVLVVSAPTDEQVRAAHLAEADAVVTTPLDLRTIGQLAVSPPVASKVDAAGMQDHPVPVIGTSPQMRDLWRRVLSVASGGSSVVVLGETGTGKELVARALHAFSPRRRAPFVAINCAALPEALLESELFGHEKGAITGATARRKGRFELADGGTLFLDEIGDLPLTLQAKLLRVLQERRFERLGGMESVEVDVRVVAATHRDLREEVERGSFRADLYFRLAVLSLRVPPLRERKEDVLPLWERFVRESAGGRRVPLETSASVHRLLLRCHWPGNIRELENAAEHAVTVASGGRVLPADLPATVTGAVRPKVPDLTGLTMREVERLAITQARAAFPSAKAAAEALGISLRKVQYRLREYRDEVASPAVELGAREGRIVPDRTRILLAEDDDELRWALTALLLSEGYEVVAVADGRALLEHLGASMLLEQREGPPDLIVSDVRMPGISGLRVLEGVRDRGWTTPVVLMSAFGDEETRHQAKALGATAFLEKPFDFGRLQQIIASVVRSSIGDGTHNLHDDPA
jgi:DNA-binding NtrC family response regulator